MREPPGEPTGGTDEERRITSGTDHEGRSMRLRITRGSMR
jgi:hypothetical protein